MRKKIIEALKKVYDLELAINLWDLGLIYGIEVSGSKVSIDMTATTPLCPYIPEQMENVKKEVEKVEGISEVQVNLVWEPKWNLSKLSEEAKAQLGLI